LLKKDIIYVSKQKNILKKFNAYKHLIDSKNLIKLFDGVYSSQNNFLKLSNKLDKVLLNYSKKNGYKEVKYSGILQTSSLIHNSYLHSFPNHCLLVSSIKRSNKALTNVAKIKVNELHQFKKHLNNPELILSPTVCYNCFETIKKTNLKKNTKFTSISKCHRYEGLNYYQLERLKVYEMRELIFFGDQVFINKQISNFIDFFIRFLNKNNLIFRIVTANDPFFLKTMYNKKIFQLTNKLKYELEMYLPFEKKWIAVGSFNNHLNTLTKKYEITKNKKTCYSGCIGIGYERFLYSYFSQKKLYNLK
jgi:seryl-tRNA synthetase